MPHLKKIHLTTHDKYARLLKFRVVYLRRRDRWFRRTPSRRSVRRASQDRPRGALRACECDKRSREVTRPSSAIERVFSGTGPGEAELGQVGWNYFTLPPSYGYYQRVYLQNGLSPSEANVNTPSDSAAPGQLEEDLKQWKEYVDAARTVGIESVAPVVGPNDPNEPKLGENVFATNPFYALERGEALYGKAIAFDVPPNFFLNGGSGPGYEKFIVQAIQWGNAHGLRTTILLSPYPWPTNSAGQLETFRQFTGNTFSRDTQDFC